MKKVERERERERERDRERQRETETERHRERERVGGEMREGEKGGRERWGGRETGRQRERKRSINVSFYACSLQVDIRQTKNKNKKQKIVHYSVILTVGTTGL